MKEQKRCIFHIPAYVNKEAKSGSSIRPYKMLEALQENGYEVHCVMGYGKERKSQIKAIKENINKGMKYDFVYSESSTMPTVLTERNHVPRYLFLDFRFLEFCKKQKMKIGLFYRDIYWKFPVYKEGVGLLKRMVSIPMYHYDLHQYKRFVDVLYLPSLRMSVYLGIPTQYKALPPGCDLAAEDAHAGKKCRVGFENHRLQLFYVGGVGSIYDLTKLFCVVQKLDFVHLTVCCREAEWTERYNYYAPQMCDRIEIVHKSGGELAEFYQSVDLSMIFFGAEGYRSFAMPIKLFEYISNRIPVIATEGSAAGDFVKDNDVGWSIKFEEDELTDLLTKLYANRELLVQKEQNMQKALECNTWKARAKQVILDLKGKGEKNIEREVTN